MFFHVQFAPASLPRNASIAPRKTSPLSAGDAATYQSYHACDTFIVGSEVIFVHVVPARRQRCGVLPADPNAYATSGDAVTRSTANRTQAAAGDDGSDTALKLLPPFADAKSPSANDVRISVVPPLGWTLMSQHFVGRLRLQLAPEFEDT